MAKGKSKLGPLPGPETAVDPNEALYRAKDDAHVLRQAGEIMSDAKRSKMASKELNKHMQAIQKIQSVGRNGAAKTPSLGFAKKKFST